jgi:hypothetical protein
MEAQHRLIWLLEALQLIAAEADIPLVLLKNADVTDEIACAWEDAYLNIGQLSADGLLPPDVVSKLAALDRQMEAMSGPHQAELWTDEALQSDPQWHQLRSQAREILADLGVAQAVPYEGPWFADDSHSRLLTTDERAVRAAARLAELRNRQR